MRKSGIKIEGYPNFIHPKNISNLSSRKHPLGNLPIYSDNDKNSHQEELLASDRYKFLIDEYCRTHNCQINEIKPINIMMEASLGGHQLMSLEQSHRTELIKIAEEIVRSEYNLDKSELLFDLEILDTPTTNFPEGMNSEDKFDFESESDIPDNIKDEIVKRRIVNSLCQGAAKKGHFMFHLAGDKLNDLIPGIVDSYQKIVLSNDILYYMMSDDDFNNFIENDQTSSYVKLNFDGDIPVIEAKAFSFPILVHEMVKGVIELLATQGYPKDKDIAKQVIETCDVVRDEMWGIRIGPELWVTFHELIHPSDYHIKKLIIRDVFKLPADEFINFFYDVLNDTKSAEKKVKYITYNILEKISEYELNKDSDEDLPEVDFSQFDI